MHTIEELFEHELRGILGAEHTLLQALEQMAGESTDRDIRKVFTLHRRETQGQIKRLERIFTSLGRAAEPGACPGMDGLIGEKEAFLRETPSEELIEFYNIGAGQKVEQYEISAYEHLIDLAEKLGLTEAIELLEQTLLQEEGALDALRSIASEFDVEEEDEDEDTENPAATDDIDRRIS